MNKPKFHQKDLKKTRMHDDDVFQFSCSKGVPCFTQCCRDVTIILTPYDVLRLKNGLGISSDEFLDLYTIILSKSNRLIPMVVLEMNEEDDKKCPFVTEKWCTVYNHRPLPCRMFPLDMHDDGTFGFITDSSRCLGLKENEKAPLSEWLFDQGVPIYDEMNSLFSQVTTPLKAKEQDIDNLKIHKMVFMALYNLDKFKDFVFKSTFLDRFDVEPIVIEKIKRNDVELLKFAFDWIIWIIGQKTFQVRPDAVPQEKTAG
ncbi:MAG: YkgJ family cysteine cluster protein [Deltaproteobacteria bacterium]|nr:YkgJ family cysteine cluster protein [Deltaproteobacteria bacterium]